MTLGEKTALARRRELWSRDFGLYFTARVMAALADGMLPVALSAGLLAAGHGTSAVGYALGAWMATFAGLVLVGGVLADWFTPRRMMVGADTVRVVTVTVMAVAFASGNPALWAVCLLQAVGGAATAMFQPGVASTVPRVASDVQRANAVLRVAEAVALLFGPAAAGVLVAFAGAGTVFGVIAGTFAVSGVSLLLLRLAPLTDAGAESRTSMVRDLRDGWQEFRSRAWLWGVIVIFALWGLIAYGPVLPLAAGLIIPEYGSSVYGLVTAAFGAGTVVGGLIGLRVRPERQLLAGAVAMLAYPLQPWAMAADQSVLVIGAGHFTAGVGIAFWGVMWSTTVQTQVPAAVLNRVYAYDVAGSIMMQPLGRALAGPASDTLGGREVLAVSTVAGFLGCVCLLAAPAIRGLRRVS
ncbi:MFS transporter [Streptomyces sp. NPDC087300]|uniref:MFS transporter n=1 Tax=Streptomyces sp. NPDC087300 TaxID=3365780 RepID=UPI0038065A67